ncbi:MAG TPA: pitrilysin family protein, partial [Armatimonadota bacterium]|nr:pitrilysin family protein [Armatimonadota bacterium]
PSNKLELFMWLDSDRMSNAVLREFYVERDVVADERRMRVDANPYGYFREEMLSVYFTAHPYGRPVGGWADDIQRITRQQAADFFATYYAPNNATLVLVGDLEPEATFAMAERYFGRVPRSPKPIADLITQEPTQHGPRRIEVSTMARPVVTINYHVPPRQHPDFYPLSIAADVLNGRSGRLHKRLVLADDIAFSVAANMDGSAHAGTFTLIAMPKGPNTHQRVEDTLVAEIDRLKSEPPTGDEMQRVKNAADAEFIGGLRSNDGLAMQLAVMDAIIDWREVIEAPAKIKAVTADQVAEVAKKYLIRDNSTVGWVTTKPMPAGQASPGGGAQ